MSGTIRWRLVPILRERGMSQVQLSRASGISENNISDLVGGAVRQMRFDTLAKLCDALGVAPHDLLEYIPDKTTDVI